MASPAIMGGVAPHLELDLLCDGAELLWRAELRAAQTAPLRAFFRRPWERSSVEETAARVARIIEHANGSGRFGAESAEELRRAGGLLFDDLLSPDLKALLRELGEGALSLNLSEALLGVPWELLHDGVAFLGERWRIGRLVVCDELPPRVPARTGRTGRSARADGVGTASLSALVLADPVGDLPEAYNEGVAIRALLEARGGVEVTFRSTSVTRDDVRELLREHDLLHVAGHVDAAGLRLRDGHLSPADVERMAGGRALPSLVFLNGCAAVGSSAADSGLARAFLRAGVSHCLGPLYDVPDAIGRELAVAFYSALGPGVAVGAALGQARAAVAAQVGARAVLWAPYAHYGAPDASLPGWSLPAPAIPASTTPEAYPIAHEADDERHGIPTLARIVATQTSTRIVAGSQVRRALAQPQPASAASVAPVLAALAVFLLVPVLALPWLAGPEPPEPAARATEGAAVAGPVAAPASPPRAPGPGSSSRDVLTYHFLVSREDETIRPLVDGQPLGPGDRLQLDVLLRRSAHLYVFRVGPSRLELLARGPGQADAAQAPNASSELLRLALPGGDGGWEPGESGYHTLVVATREAPWDDVAGLVAYLNDVLARAPEDAGEWHDERALRVVRDALERRGAEVYTARYEARIWD